MSRHTGSGRGGGVAVVDLFLVCHPKPLPGWRAHLQGKDTGSSPDHKLEQPGVWWRQGCRDFRQARYRGPWRYLVKIRIRGCSEARLAGGCDGRDVRSLRSRQASIQEREHREAASNNRQTSSGRINRRLMQRKSLERVNYTRTKNRGPRDPLIKNWKTSFT